MEKNLKKNIYIHIYMGVTESLCCRTKEPLDESERGE